MESLLDKLATRDTYHSHGSVIDASEASSLGLKVEHLQPTDDLWRKLWLLRTMYAFDCRTRGYANCSKVGASAVRLWSSSRRGLLERGLDLGRLGGRFVLAGANDATLKPALRELTARLTIDDTIAEPAAR